MDITLGHAFLIAHDPDAALGFYRDALGLDVLNDVDTPQGRWVTLASPSQPDVQLILTDPYAGQSKEDGDTILGLVTKGALSGLLFRTTDLDATFEKLRAAGAEVMQEPIEQPWGAKDCAFRDPSGNLVRIAQA